jgi:homoserine dehydrogenase
VRPEAIPVDSFLGGFRGSDMGIVFETDIYETVYMKTDEEGVFPTAAAMLRDLNDICSGMETWR